MSEAALSNTERQQLLRQYAEIATLAGGLAHEIKNPLGTISMNLELLVEDLQEGDSPRDRRMLRKVQVIQKQCEHLLEILDDFLKFARVGQLETTSTDLNQVVRDFIVFFEPQALAAHVELSPHLATDLPKVQVDVSLIRQVLMNLALNALQAMPHGGLLELQTTVSSKGMLELHLIDNGTGMDDRTLGKIFDVFFSTKPGGSGLGLPTVRKIIEAHGGDLTVQSAPGKGTRFTISLPSDSTANLA